jgi:uncharacterized repeat protein (TIGR04138 family)
MQPIHFEDVVDGIVKRDPRYHRDAYAFLRDALDFTQSLVNRRSRRSSRKRSGEETADEEPKHVNGPELLKGVREFALEQYGPMTVMVFEEWGITQTRDFGEIVFNMVGESLLSKTETDRLDDFENIYDFSTAFLDPFLPQSKQGRSTDTPQSN